MLGATPNFVGTSVSDAAPAEAPQQRVQEQRAATQAPVSSQMSGIWGRTQVYIVG
jgi:hypothetical protein